MKRQSASMLFLIFSFWLAAVIACSRSSRSKPDYPLAFRAKEILEFQQVQGNPQWIDRAKTRFLSAVWEFESDGTFTFAPANSRSDLYPLKGKFAADGNKLIYSASAEARVANTGSASAQIFGEISLDSNSPEVTLNWISSSGSAAVINETPFASADSTAYKIRAVLTSDD
jgi:hypothetical protein